jgi:hypothetical protein
MTPRWSPRRSLTRYSTEPSKELLDQLLGRLLNVLLLRPCWEIMTSLLLLDVRVNNVYFWPNKLC